MIAGLREGAPETVGEDGLTRVIAGGRLNRQPERGATL